MQRIMVLYNAIPIDLDHQHYANLISDSLVQMPPTENTALCWGTTLHFSYPFFFLTTNKFVELLKGYIISVVIV